MPVWCKICGIKTPTDALVVADSGADAIGLNFYSQSARFVTPQGAQQIVSAVNDKDILLVGVFVNADAQYVERCAQSGQLDLLQFHGDESVEFCEQFSQPYIKVLKASAKTKSDIALYKSAWAIMLDTAANGEFGGTGHTFDWELWPGDLHERMLLAGGLDPNNVGAAIGQLMPFGVDVSSGVETSVKGVKDPQKIADFVQAVRLPIQP